MLRGVVLWSLILAGSVVPIEKLQPKTIDAWNDYVRQTEERLSRSVNGENFLFTDQLPAAQRDAARKQMDAGKIFVLHTGGKSRAVESGLIHDWLGAAFLPGAKLEPLLKWVEDYDAHAKYFQEVERSKLISREGDVFKIYYRFRRKKVITVYYNTDHTVDYHVLANGRAYSRSVAMRIAEVEHPGASNENEMPVGDDSGFLWRLNSYWRFQETPAGVYVECESLSLSRPIPTGFAWAVQGFVESVPKESLENTLTSIRKGFSAKQP